MALNSGFIDPTLLDAALADSVVIGDADDNIVPAESGNGYVDGREGNDSLFGGAGNDILIGGAGDDFLSGQEGDDIAIGGSGDDRVLASSGADFYDGGSGFDTLDFSAMSAGLNIDVSKGTATGAGVVSFDSFEKIIGTAFNDTIKGSNQADVISGGLGDDLIRSMAGNDTLTGGEGRDTFKFMAKDVMAGGVHQGVDVITDFRSNDTLDLRDFFKGRVEDVDSIVHLRETNDGSIVSVRMGDAFVDVALLKDFYVATATAGDLAGDGMILA